MVTNVFKIKIITFKTTSLHIFIKVIDSCKIQTIFKKNYLKKIELMREKNYWDFEEFVNETTTTEAANHFQYGTYN